MKRPSHTPLLIIGVMLALATLTSGCPEEKQDVTVPELVGMSQEAAEAALESVGLTLGDIAQASCDTVAEGLVMNQQPPAGNELPQGAAVDITISTGALSAVYFPAEALADMAADLYETLATGGDAVPVIRDLFDALGMYQDPTQPGTTLLALLDEGYPMVLEDQVRGMANGFDQGFFIPLESLVEHVVTFGAYARNPEGPLTVSHLSDGFAPLLELEELEVEEVLPALVLYLGHERAAWLGGPVDPVWGDHDLDPVQFTLMIYAILMAGEDKAVQDIGYLWPLLRHAPPQQKSGAWQNLLRPVGDFTRSMARNVISGFISDILGVPLSIEDAARAILCGSTMLYSYHLELNLDNDAIWYRRPENPEARAYWSDIIATLHFDFEPYNNASRIAIEAACMQSLPDNGPVGGKPVTWTLAGELPAHGSLDIRDNATRSNGTARAIYYANEEKVPLLLRRETLWDIADGYVEVVVKDLLPQWSAIEVIVRHVRGVGIDRVYLTVSHFEFPELTLEFETYITALYGTEEDEVTGHFDANFPLDFHEDVLYYHGTGTLHYISGSYTPGAEDCHAELEPHSNGDMSMYLYIEPEKTELVVQLGFSPIPTEVITIYCPEGPPMTLPPTSMAFSGWTLAHFDITDPLFFPIPGPWHAGAQGAPIVATTTYTRHQSMEDINATAAVTMNLRQR